ncbi:MAG TPA: glycoside hydrolase family 16 protein, partial [Flavilitoribacter sp.]|nr:glycoside hydrolase family 16 protein [Flavilitoribacter sp.]
LVWSDEFNAGGAPDTAVWSFERGFVRNREDQWYQSENAFCKDGFLIIEARKERRLNPDFVKGSPDWKKSRQWIDYTSTSMTTRKSKAWQYGRLEIRARIDIQSGSWPAFWTLGVAGEWPRNGEVDIMEFYRGVILANFAWGGVARFRPHWNSVKVPVSSFNKNWASDFHTWRLDWAADSMKIYLDGVLLNEMDLSVTVNESDGKNPFRQPHYILINQALGGDNGGSLTDAVFPFRYEIDYVRVYQKQDK